MTNVLKRLLAAAFVATVCPVLALAQGDEIFKVIACKGKVTLQRTNKAVSVGTGLTSADRLIMDGPVYVGLVHKSGKAVEVKAGQQMAVADLLKQVSSKQTGMDKLVGFVVQSVVGANDGKNEMSGGAERSIAVNKVRMLAPRTSKVIDPDVTFSWAGNDGTTKEPTYIFTLTDDKQNVRFKKELKETSLALNLNQLGLEKDKCYYWSVVQANSNAQSFESYCIYPVNDAEAAAINGQLSAIKQEQGNTPSALDKLILASFFEQNGLTYKALGAYKEAVALGGDVEIFGATYSQFLRRINMDSEAQKLMMK
jgi:hypothetical protein